MRARGAWRGKSLSLRVNIRQVESEFGGIRAVNMVALLKSEPVRRTASIKSELYIHSELVVVFYDTYCTYVRPPTMFRRGLDYQIHI